MSYTINTNKEMIKYFLERVRITRSTSKVSINPRLLNGKSEDYMAGNIQTMNFFDLEKMIQDEVVELSAMNKVLVSFLNYKYKINLKITNKKVDQNSINAIVKTIDRIMRNLKGAGIVYNQPININLTSTNESPYCVDNNIYISDLSDFIMTLSHELGHCWENQNISLYEVLNEPSIRACNALHFNEFLDKNINYFKYSPQNAGNTKEKIALVFEFLIYATLPKEIDKKPVFLQENKDADIILMHKEQLEREYRTFKTMDNDLCLVLYSRTVAEQEAKFAKDIKALMDKYEAATIIKANTKEELVNAGFFQNLGLYLKALKNAKIYGDVKVL